MYDATAHAPLRVCTLTFSSVSRVYWQEHELALINRVTTSHVSGMKSTTQPATSTTQKKGIFKNFKLFLFLNLLGYSITSSTFYFGYHYGDFIPVPAPPPGSNITTIDMSIRLAFALRCSIPLALCLFAAVALVGNKRSVTDAVDPLSGNEHIVQIDKNFLANTLEQCVIGLIFVLVVASYAETPQELRLLPIFAVVFTVARILFRIGYGVHYLLRAFGMSANICANYVIIGVALYSLATKGLHMHLYTTAAPNRIEL